MVGIGPARDVLRNDRYLGKLTWNRTLWRKDPDSGRRIRVERPESEHITHTDERLRVVTDETWAAVRSHDAPVNEGAHFNTRLKAPLSGLLMCAECGKPMTLAGGVNSRGMGSRRYVCRTYKEHKDAPGYGCSNRLTVSRAVVEDLIIQPLRARLESDPQWIKAFSAWLSQKQRTDSARWDLAMNLRPAMDTQPPPVIDPDAQAALSLKLEALKAAELAGVLTPAEAKERATVFRAEFERQNAGLSPGDAASILANAEALQAALEGAATDALREALRRTLGTVRCRPITDDGAPYLQATFKGGDMPLLSWLAGTDSGNDAGISALVAGAGFEPATFGL